jgi:hypothetical protein
MSKAFVKEGSESEDDDDDLEVAGLPSDRATT